MTRGLLNISGTNLTHCHFDHAGNAWKAKRIEASFSAKDYLKSLEKSVSIKPDIICAGHYYFLYEECHRVLEEAYKKGQIELLV